MDRTQLSRVVVVGLDAREQARWSNFGEHSRVLPVTGPSLKVATRRGVFAKQRSVFYISLPKDLADVSSTFPLKPGTKPINRTPYRVDPWIQGVIHECVGQLVDDGVVEKRSSQWGSPVTTVTKPDSLPRFCVNYRKTTAQSTTCF